MIQTDPYCNDKFVLRTDQGRYNFYDNHSVKSSAYDSESWSELNFYVEPRSSHSLQGFQLKPCEGTYRISKVLIVNSCLCTNHSTHFNSERISESWVKLKSNAAPHQNNNSENKKEFKSQSDSKRWKLGKPCKVFSKCTNNSGLAFVINRNKSQNCPGILSQENQQESLQKCMNTTCFTLKVRKENQNNPIEFEEKKVMPKSTNTSHEHIKFDSCKAMVSKKVTFDLTNAKTKSSENFMPCKSNLRKGKNPIRPLKCNYVLSGNKGIFSNLGQPPEGLVGILKNGYESRRLKVNYGCSDFRERLMREVHRYETRHTLGFPLKDSLVSYNMYPN